MSVALSRSPVAAFPDDDEARPAPGGEPEGKANSRSTNGKFIVAARSCCAAKIGENTYSAFRFRGSENSDGRLTEAASGVSAARPSA